MSRYSLCFVLASICLFAIHLTLGFLGQISVAAVMLLPMCATMLSAFLHFLFAYCISKNSFSILAGYDAKKDDKTQVKKQLNAISLLNSAIALFFNILFFAAYALPDGDGAVILSLIALGVYIIVFAVVVIGVNIKIKTRQ